VRAFFKEALPEDIRRKAALGQRYAPDDLRRWQRILYERGWATPAWDKAWGGTGWSPVQQYIFQEELQAKVIDLKRSHSELQEIAYAASHDLQEPLRKIQVFSNMLLYQKSGDTGEDSKLTLQRISNSANRMQLLITDLMSLTNLTKTDEVRSPVQLNSAMDFCWP